MARLRKFAPEWQYPISKLPKFLGWTKPDYEEAEVLWVDPMTAKELDEKKQAEVYKNPDKYYIEEKFDGTRGVLHFYENYNRVFSRRVSKKTDWLTENTDSVPHIRDLQCASLAGTVLDGEMFIPSRPFKDVAAVMNCNYDNAIERQSEIGWVVFHAFDILYFKGENVMDKPIEERKEYLNKALYELSEVYEYHLPVISVPYCQGRVEIYPKSTPQSLDRTGSMDIPEFWANHAKFGVMGGTYPALAECINKAFAEDQSMRNSEYPRLPLVLNYRAYYEYIVATGGEGVMVKPLGGKYYQKRGWEYSKIKKFLTRDVIITGFTEPTKEYEGKFPELSKWDYWESSMGEKFDLKDLDVATLADVKGMYDDGELIPITRYYYMGWVGNIEYGVIITSEEFKEIVNSKKSFDIKTMIIDGKEVNVLNVGDCAGFDDEMRDSFTKNRHNLIGAVVEVKANEQFKDTGKLRHPRFVRLRPDKEALACTWKDHFG